MASITTRAGKGSPLTNAELDANFNNINAQLSTAVITGGTIDGATIGATTATTGKFSQLDVDNLRLDANTISSTDTNGNVTIAPNGTGIATFSKATVVSTTDNTNAALRITQLGTGNALLVEDASNPDTTPFVIDNLGTVVNGYTTPLAVGAFTPRYQQHGNSANFRSMSLTSWQGGTDVGPEFIFARGDNSTIGDYTLIGASDVLGNIRFYGADGTAMVEAARITAAVDGTPGTNDMPGRLVFSTTADGASSPTERMRIDSSGNVGIGTASPTAPLTVSSISSTVDVLRLYGASDGAVQTETGIAFNPGTNAVNPSARISSQELDASDSRASLLFYTRDSNSDVAPTERMRIDSSGDVGIGTSSPSSKLDVAGQVTSTSAMIKSTSSTGLIFNDTVADRWQIVNRDDAGDVLQIVSGNINSGGTSIANLSSAGSAFTNIGLGLTTPTTSGTGITFPATQQASSNANTLDDYEEGTFTPTAIGGSSAGTTTYTSQNGKYTKIGRLVTARFNISYSSLTGTGELVISLPFVADGEYMGSIMTNGLNWSGSGTSLTVYTVTSAATCRIFISGDDISWSVQQCVNESADFIITVTYFV